MSRTITTGFRDEITSTHVRPIYLAQFVFDSETLRFWNGTAPFDYDGDTYTGAGNLLKFDEIEETQKIEARGMKFNLSGIPSALIAIALGEEYQDRAVTIDLAFLDADGAIIADPYRFFSGKADVMSITDGAETATISLTAESDIIALLRVNERRRTPEDQKLTYSGDTFFDTVAALQSKEIIWGGKN